MPWISHPVCHLLPIPISASSIRSSSSPPPAGPPCVDEALEWGEVNGSGEGAGDLTRCTETEAGEGRLFSDGVVPPTT